MFCSLQPKPYFNPKPTKIHNLLVARRGIPEPERAKRSWRERREGRNERSEQTYTYGVAYLGVGRHSPLLVLP